MLESLKQNLQDSPSLRCIVIGSNDKVFSAGHDLKELTSKTGQDYHKTVFDVCSQVMLAIRNMPVPVIAEVKGVAAAAGCQLVAATDIAIASEEAMFSTPGARVGLFCSTPGIEVARAANQKTAAYMLFTGNFITANGKCF
ncbi:enoyl-CoA hydratase domain-containing protein 3-like protein [Leptotrombidium deliense]|uniref:Enoyl-CoA hydratase domain-containing protein 3-like protein n=1 Tax=Leptotrombidium deliense TaxID=299467 RepID=A0A443SAD3_9ACAR|nr:enoyl-CoA hydratase domain-containing protein 3-like protein [Leptotrombidium deliense]